MRKRELSAATWSSHMSSVVPSELEKTSAGAPSTPSQRWWRRSATVAVVRERTVDERVGAAQIARLGEVGPHPLGVDLEPLQALAQRSHRAARQRQRRAER